MNFKVVLASASPRRQELLKYIFPKFDVSVSSVQELVPDNISIRDIPEYLAALKAAFIAGRLDSDSLVIGADTCVIYKETVLGKPSDQAEAFRMLKMLSGNVHQVITGCCLIMGNRKHSFSVKTDVEFFNLNDDEIKDYILNSKPFDKAGSYGIQDKGSLFVKEIKGDYFNVVGLPVSTLNREIHTFLNARQLF